jgi:hypothetical protein
LPGGGGLGRELRWCWWDILLLRDLFFPPCFYPPPSIDPLDSGACRTPGAPREIRWGGGRAKAKVAGAVAERIVVLKNYEFLVVDGARLRR